ncbi:hypothetical protein [Nostoc sp. 'Peltigera membranacea cyanobiont' 232]|uniref:hypothetical protein n=1 Tax=Nostoc sp. 'Peltigera membranacea cyanobiont' 232 TaxID=2014531 RepID=UPI000B95601A|nr:hypothetical protein [Nostoc sp. 'Peltigera membranacea cyanobiont' 232]OYE01432.1 hypothetical protein CDG79_29535 [Nostoc sp. 'Peltigera membranacea cyanobiont' 232]
MKNSEIINELMEAGKVLSVIVSRTPEGKIWADFTVHFTEEPIECSECFKSVDDALDWVAQTALNLSEKS